jgi:hypothetical protein
MEIRSTDSQNLDFTLRQRAMEAGMLTIKTAPAEVAESAGLLPRFIGMEALSEVMRLPSSAAPLQ